MFALRRALRGLARHPGLHAATVATAALTLLVVGSLALIYYNLEEVVSDWQAQFRMVAVLRPNLAPGEAADLERALLVLPGVAGAEHVDSRAALEALAQRLNAGSGPADAAAGRARLVELLSGNPLPSSFRLRVAPLYQTPGALRLLARQAGSFAAVAEVRYGEAWAARFYSFFRLFKLVAAATCGLLFVSATFIISGQIRMALSLRQGEIDLLRLLGAGEARVMAPYLLEGALLGAAGAALSLAVLLGLFRLLAWQAGTEVESLLAGTRFLPPAAALGLVAFGAAVGLLGSLVSMRRLPG